MSQHRLALLLATASFIFSHPVHLQFDVSGGLWFRVADLAAAAQSNGNGGGNGNGGSNNGGGNGNGAGNNGAGNGNGGGNNGAGNGNGGGLGAGGSDPGGKGNAGGNAPGRSDSMAGGPSSGGAEGNRSSGGNQGGHPGAHGSGGFTGEGKGHAPGHGATGHAGGAGPQIDAGRTKHSAGRAPGEKPGSIVPQDPILRALSELFGAVVNTPRPNSTKAPASGRTVTPQGNTVKADSIRGTARQTARSTGSQGQRAQTSRSKSLSSQPQRTQPWPSGLAKADEPQLRPRQGQRSLVASGLTDQSMAKLIARGFRLDLQTRGTFIQRVARLRLPEGMSLDRARRVIRVVDATASTDLDHFYYTDEGGPGCSGPECAATSLVGWNLAASDQCGAIPTIGVIDTGIDLEHEALKGQSISILQGPRGAGNPSHRDHGTAIAALLVGRSASSTPGLLPRARVVAVDAFYRDAGTADRTDVASLVAAMEALTERGVRIINMSLSGPPNDILRSAIEAAQAKGVVFVAAVGNGGAKAEPSYPAAYPGVIAVTAVDRQLNAYRRATRGEYVDVAAPGVDLLVASSAQDRTTKSGTSYAVPFVSAAAAMLRASDQTMDASSLKAQLELYARDLGAPGRDSTYGYGLIQMSRLCQPSPNAQTIVHSMPDGTATGE